MYRPDENQMAQENGQTIHSDSQVILDAGLAEPESDLTAQDEPVSIAFAAVAPADLEPAAPFVPEPSSSTPDGDGVEPPGMDDSNARDQSLTPVLAVVDSSVAESPAIGKNTTSSGSWSEIQARFVDDPRASIELAAGLVDDRVKALAASVRNRQESLRSAWQGQDAGTEEMRLALQHYRAFWHRLGDYPAE
jgi:hypothetical protein